MEGHLAIIWLMIVSVGILITVVYMRKFTNEERTMMIEKGIDPSDMLVKQAKAMWPLRFALLFIGAGLGLFVGYFLDALWNMEEVAYFSMLLIFGGTGLGLAYIIEDRKEKEAQAKEAA